MDCLQGLQLSKGCSWQWKLFELCEIRAGFTWLDNGSFRISCVVQYRYIAVSRMDVALQSALYSLGGLANIAKFA